jgi:hypothetical protein
MTVNYAPEKGQKARRRPGSQITARKPEEGQKTRRRPESQKKARKITLASGRKIRKM